MRLVSGRAAWLWEGRREDRKLGGAFLFVPEFRSVFLGIPILECTGRDSSFCRSLDSVLKPPFFRPQKNTRKPVDNVPWGTGQ